MTKLPSNPDPHGLIKLVEELKKLRSPGSFLVEQFLKLLDMQIPDTPRTMSEENIRRYLTERTQTSLNAFGQTVRVDVEDRLTVISDEAILRRNRVLSETNLPDVISEWLRDKSNGESQRQLAYLATAEDGIRGYAITGNGRVALRDVGHALQCEAATLYSSSKLQWSTPLAARVAPLVAPNGHPVVPIIGGLYWKGELLTDATNPKIDLNPVVTTNEHGERTAATHIVYYRHGRSLIIPASSEIFLRKLPSGGYELPRNDFQSTDPDMVRIPVVAYQYVGTGIRGYTHRWYKVKMNTPAPLQPGEEILQLVTDSSFSGGAGRLTQPRYWGKDGIFLDLKHQELCDSATGGNADAHTALEVEKSLLEHGAKIGAITVGVCTLVTARELAEAVGLDQLSECRPTYVQLKAVTDSTIRLSSLIGHKTCFEAPKHPTAFYDLPRIVETYQGDMELSSVYRYLDQVAETMGTNINACMRGGYTLRPHDGTSDNLSLTGMICDAENFVRCTTPGEYIHLVLPWFFDICRLCAVIDMRTEDFLVSSMLQKFLHPFCDDDEVNVATYSSDGRPFSTREEKMRLIACDITGAGLLNYHQRQGVVLDLAAIHSDLHSECPLRQFFLSRDEELKLLNAVADHSGNNLQEDEVLRKAVLHYYSYKAYLSLHSLS